MSEAPNEGVTATSPPAASAADGGDTPSGLPLPEALLEEWMRRYYFEVDADLGSSGVEDFSLAEIRELTGISVEQLDSLVLRDSRTLGGDELRQALADRFLAGDASRVIATHGSTEANFLVMQALLAPGDEVVVLEPIYQQLRAIAEALGCRLRGWPMRPERGFHPDVEEVASLIGPSTRMVVVNFPHNPTGATLDRDEQRHLVAAARRHGAWLVWDGAFSELVYAGEPLPEPLLEYERAVSMGTLSKAYGLPGLRVGWCLASEQVLRRFVRLRDYLTLHLSPLVELFACHAIRHGDRLVGLRRRQAMANLATVEAWMERHSDHVDWFPPRGGVSAFPRLPRVDDVTDFCRRLAERERVMLVPGECFGFPRHVRFGFGCAPATLELGLAGLSRALETAACRSPQTLPHRGPLSMPTSLQDRADTSLGIHQFEFTPGEVEQLRELLADLGGRYSSSEDPELLRRAAVLAHELPARLRQHLVDFRLHEPQSGLCLLDGYPVEQPEIGPTPKHWKDRSVPPATLGEELFLLLAASILGDPIGWSTQQAGFLVHDIFPIQGHEHEQLGSGSEELLTWHVEDAFHPCRGDYIGLMCLRNPYRVATTVGHLEGARIDPDMARVLAQPRFTIRPDESHLAKNRPETQNLTPTLERAYRRIEQMNTAPEKIAVLFGDPAFPYLRLDPYFMDPLDGDPEAQRALEHLQEVIEGRLFDLVLDAGQVIFIDNYKAVHGRRPFKARYDGSDRWLKRVNVTRDLRKSRELRESAESRTIF